MSLDLTRRFVIRCRFGLAAMLTLLSACTMSGAPAGGPAGPPDAPLVNTYWKLMTLQGDAVVVAQGFTEPHFVLQPGGRRVAGSGGCNRLMGDYTVSADQLKFGLLATTRMACPGADRQEQRFLDTLAAVTRWRVQGERLRLFDGNGQVVAEFESRHLR